MITKLEKALELSKTHQITNNSYFENHVLATPSLCLRMAHLDAHPIVSAAVLGAVGGSL